MTDTLAQARQQFRSALTPGGGGAICPCCERIAKLRKRPLDAEMAHTLRKMSEWDDGHPDKWVHVDDHLTRRHKNSRNYSWLRFWDLIEEGPGRGLWRITRKGKLFVRGQIRLPRAFWMYNRKDYGKVGEEINFAECLLGENEDTINRPTVDGTEKE